MSNISFRSFYPYNNNGVNRAIPNLPSDKSRINSGSMQNVALNNYPLGLSPTALRTSLLIPDQYKMDIVSSLQSPVSVYTGNGEIKYKNNGQAWSSNNTSAPGIIGSNKVDFILFLGGDYVNKLDEQVPFDTDTSALYYYNVDGKSVTQRNVQTTKTANSVYYLNSSKGLFPIAYFTRPYFSDSSCSNSTLPVNTGNDLVDRYYKVDITKDEQNSPSVALNIGGENNQNGVINVDAKEVFILGFRDANGDFQQVNIEADTFKDMKDLLNSSDSPIRDSLVAKHFPGEDGREVTWQIKKKLVYTTLELGLIKSDSTTNPGAVYRNLIFLTDDVNSISFNILHKFNNQPRNLSANRPEYKAEKNQLGNTAVKISVKNISISEIPGFDGENRQWTLKVKNKSTGAIEEISTAKGLTPEVLATQVFAEASLVKGEDGKYTLTGNLKGVVNGKELKIFDQNYECYIDYTDTVEAVDNNGDIVTTTINSSGQITLSATDKPSLDNEERTLSADQPIHDIKVDEKGKTADNQQIIINNISWSTDIVGLKDEDRQWSFHIGNDVILTSEAINPNELFAQIMKEGYKFEKQENGKYKLTGVLKENINGHKVDVFGNTAIYIDYRDKTEVSIDNNGSLVEGFIQSSGQIAFNTPEKKVTYQNGTPEVKIKIEHNPVEGSTIFLVKEKNNGQTNVELAGEVVQIVPQNFERYELHLDKNVAVVYMNTAGKMVSLYPQRQADNGKYVYEINDENFQYFVSEDAGQGQLYLVVKAPAEDNGQKELVGIPVAIPENKNLQFENFRKEELTPRFDRLLNSQQEAVLLTITSLQTNATPVVNFTELLGNNDRRIVWRRDNGQEYEITTDPKRQNDKNVIFVEKDVYTLDELKKIITAKEGSESDLSADVIVAIPKNYQISVGFSLGNHLVNDPLSAARALHDLGLNYQDYLKTGNLKTDFGFEAAMNFYRPGAMWFRNFALDTAVKYSLYHQKGKGNTNMLDFSVSGLTELLTLNKGLFNWSPYIGAGFGLRVLLSDTITKLPANADTSVDWRLGSPFIWNLADQKFLFTSEVYLKWTQRGLTKRDYLDFKSKMTFDWFKYSGLFNSLQFALGYDLNSSERVKIGGQGNYLAVDQHQLSLSGNLQLFNFMTANAQYAWSKDVFTGKSTHDVKLGLALNNFGTDRVKFGLGTDYWFNSRKNNHRNSFNFSIMPGRRWTIDLFDGSVDYGKGLPTLYNISSGLKFTPNQWWNVELSIFVNGLAGYNPSGGGKVGVTFIIPPSSKK